MPHAATHMPNAPSAFDSEYVGATCPCCKRLRARHIHSHLQDSGRPSIGSGGGGGGGVRGRGGAGGGAGGGAAALGREAGLGVGRRPAAACERGGRRLPSPARPHPARPRPAGTVRTPLPYTARRRACDLSNQRAPRRRGRCGPGRAGGSTRHARRCAAAHGEAALHRRGEGLTARPRARRGMCGARLHLLPRLAVSLRCSPYSTPLPPPPPALKSNECGQGQPPAAGPRTRRCGARGGCGRCGFGSGWLDAARGRGGPPPARRHRAPRCPPALMPFWPRAGRAARAARQSGGRRPTD